MGLSDCVFDAMMAMLKDLYENYSYAHGKRGEYIRLVADMSRAIHVLDGFGHRPTRADLEEYATKLVDEYYEEHRHLHESSCEEESE